MFNCVAQISFEVNVITPFSGVTLEIGGAVETYWKSISTPVSTPTARFSSPRFMPPPRSIASAQTSPSTYSLTTTGNHALTHSSVSGNFIYITVQVTRDLQPITFCEWRLPEETYELGVADVSLSQFMTLSHRVGRSRLPASAVSSSTTLHNLHKAIAGSMMPLSDLLKVSASSGDTRTQFIHGRLTTAPLAPTCHSRNLSGSCLPIHVHTDPALHTGSSRSERCR